MNKVVLLIFLLSLAVRIYSVFPLNTIVGYDQARDLFSAYSIAYKHDLKIIGPTAGNNPDLHHGVAFYYYLAMPMLLFGPNPMNAVYFNVFIQGLAPVVLYFFALELFRNKKSAIMTGVLAASSYHLNQFAGWLSNPTATVITVPMYYFSLWKYLKNDRWLVAAAFFLGLSIQFELFFLYLIPATLIYFVLFRPNAPSLKTLLASLAVFALTLGTMIATEIKFGFAGAKSLIFAGQSVGGNLPFWDRVRFFSTKLSDQLSLSIVPAVPTFLAIIAFIIIYQNSKKKTKKSLRFLYLYLSSPFLMVLLGVHNAPWFLVALPASIIILYGFLFSRTKALGLLLFIAVVGMSLYRTHAVAKNGQALLEPDMGAILSRQIAAIDYTYKESYGEKFSIDTVTNPLYINALWAYHYMWHGEGKYGYLPNFIGGKQEPPYNTLPESDFKDKYLFLITDMTPRIPESYKTSAEKSALSKAKLIETANFNGIEVKKFESLSD